jgi:dipeptidyl aminopeptidase/acylaminoacyl peptidase
MRSLLAAPARRALLATLAFAPLSLPAQRTPASNAAGFTLEQIKSYPFPNELVAAPSGSRIAWALNEQGKRNVWVADAPDYRARRLTSYSVDDGQELTSVALSRDGAYVVYVRGGDHGSNWDGPSPNPMSSPVAPKIQIWSVPFAGGTPKLLADGDDPVISPKGDAVAFVREKQLWTVPVDGSAPARRMFSARGDVSDAQWSPDGSRVAFVSSRGDHSFVGVYTNDSTPIRWLAPSTSRDGTPRWSPAGTHLVFVRRPGVGGAPETALEQHPQPWALWTADAATGEARQLWRSPETLRGSVPSTQGGYNLHWAAGGRIAFLSYMDGWPHLYSISEGGGEPLLLTPGRFMAEYISLSPDGRSLLFTANAGSTPDDLERRHVVRVPVDRAAPEVLTPGTGLEWTPVVTGDGRSVAYIGATAQRPPLPMVMPVAGGKSQAIGAELIPADFPTSQLVVPKAVTFRSSDGVEVHAQLFERAGGPARKPAIVFVHGGPPRQMLLGWHYSDYYTNAYASNQYLASQGYAVLSVNYRLGIGYGFDFHRAPNSGAQGAAEYLDVKGAADYLRTLPQVNASRIGIYGGSYGGYLTALALARNSDLFAAGVDIHGVHDWTADGGRRFGGTDWRYEKTDREKAADVAWQASPVASMATWKSPVLLIHGDDDRNVRFSSTVDLARRLSGAGVRYEEIVIPDDTHHMMRHANWLLVDRATAEFFDRTLRRGERTAER